MVHAMAKATYELRGDKLHLLKGHTLPASMVQATISIDEIDPIALCAKLNTEFSAELNTVNAPKLTAAGFWHAWGMPCHEYGDPAQPVSGVKVRYQ